MTTPKVVLTICSLRGKSDGQAERQHHRQRAAQSAPSEHVLHDQGKRSRVSADEPPYDVDNQGPRQSHDEIGGDDRQPGIEQIASGTSRPISRKTTELRAKATYSQKVSTATRVDGDMPVRAP